MSFQTHPRSFGIDRIDGCCIALSYPIFKSKIRCKMEIPDLDFPFIKAACSFQRTKRTVFYGSAVTASCPDSV